MRFREAEPDDAGPLFTWRNDLETRRQSRNTEAVTWDDHLAWLEDVLAAPDRFLLIGEDDRGRVGTVRLDVSGSRAEISITVAPERRGEGLATQLIREGTRRISVSVDAWIREDNVASKRAFERAGYDFAEAVKGWERFVHP